MLKTKMQTGLPAYIEGESTTSYTYNLVGQRVQRQTMSAFCFSASEAPKIDFQRTHQGRKLKTQQSCDEKYVFDGANVIADYDGDSSDAYLRGYLTTGLDNNEILFTDNGGSPDDVHYYFKDGLGSIRQIIDDAATPAVEAYLDYYAFGSDYTPQTSNISANRYKWKTQQFYSKSSNYFLNHNQIYDPYNGLLINPGLDPFNDNILKNMGGPLRIKEGIERLRKMSEAIKNANRPTPAPKTEVSKVSPKPWVYTDYQCGPDVTEWFQEEINVWLKSAKNYNQGFMKYFQDSPTPYERLLYLKIMGPQMMYKAISFNCSECPLGSVCANSVTLCGKCIHSSELGNFIFGLVAESLKLAYWSIDRITYLWHLTKPGNDYTDQDQGSIRLGWHYGEAVRYDGIKDDLCTFLKKDHFYMGENISYNWGRMQKGVSKSCRPCEKYKWIGLNTSIKGTQVIMHKIGVVCPTMKIFETE